MSIKNDRWIRRMSTEHRMIEPFCEKQEFRIFTNALSAIVDPKDFDSKVFIEYEGDVCIIPPNSFALARSVEYFRIPRNVLTICVGKSTYARCGIITNVTPLPAKVYANEGIAQVVFFQSDEVCEVSYADRKGKYQKQDTPTLPQI